MSVLWLMLKVLLGIVGILLGILILAIILLLFLPIDYLIECEKYDDISLYGKVKVFYILSIVYSLKDEQSDLYFKILGKRIKKKVVKPKKVELEKVKSREVDSKEIDKVAQLVPSTTKETEQKIEENTTRPAATQISKKEQEDKKELIKKQITEQETIKKEEILQKKSKSNQIQEIWDDAKHLWENKYRKPFIRETKKLFIRLWRALKPRRLHFDIVIGTGDPADTGELLAKASLFYPFYARYGLIHGDFEEKGIWGEVMTAGRLRLYRLIKPILIFLINKPVRNYIKIILNMRKEEKNGI